IDCFFQRRFSGYARQVVAIQGRENLEAALAKGKGIIALGAHIGNFVLVGTRLGLEGLLFHTLFRLPPDRTIKAILDSLQKPLHQQIIPLMPKRKAAVRILEVLNRNEIVFILADNLRTGKVHTRLFGQRVHTSRGPTSLALRSGAAVVPMYMIRDYQGTLQLVIEPEIPMVRSANLAQDIPENMHRIAQYLEGLIRRYPDQWNWLTVRMRGPHDSQTPRIAPKTAPQGCGPAPQTQFSWRSRPPDPAL
ncbi:MAG: lysophospholipid acyltransferase family protein, partial [Candidatus Binatia bacterium]